MRVRWVAAARSFRRPRGAGNGEEAFDPAVDSRGGSPYPGAVDQIV